MIKLNWPVIRAIAVRDLRRYASSPTGYVFVFLFIFLSAIGAFWQGRFFANNLANLDQLNDLFPYLLLFFIPALTMTVWADERKQGTDELLLTLPATDLEIVLGKYLSVVGVYTASLLLSLSHVIVLLWLGSPDLGLLFANYLGYWLIGLAFLAIGMFASLLTSVATIAFVLGSLLCAVLVFLDSAQFTFNDTLRRMLAPVSVFSAFGDFSRGVISLSGLFYFISIAGLMIYGTVILLGRRHWPAKKEPITLGTHHWIRAAALIIGIVALNIILSRLGGRLDATAEQLHSLSNETVELIQSIPENRPVLIQAYISPEVPRDYVQVRASLIGKLREIASVGGNKLQVAVYETEPYTDAARDAREKFGIVSREVVSVEGGRLSSASLFMGVAFTSGPREEVVSFFDRGLPVEYELVRSIRVATNASRKRIGVVETQAKVFGGFDFQSMNSNPAWQIVSELKKQYDVTSVNAEQPIAADLDGVLAILPSSLSQPAQENLARFALSGKPTLIFEDPLPLINPQLSPLLPSNAQSNPFMQQQQQQAAPKGELAAFMASVGVSFNPQTLVWDAYNPHPDLGQIQPEIVFVGRGNEKAQAFNDSIPATAGLQEVVSLFGGYLFAAPESKATFTPLLRSGRLSGTTDWNSIVQRSFFGLNLNRNPNRQATGESYVLAARISGPITTPVASGTVNAIVVADIDMISDQFFTFRERGAASFNFDNVSFALNCMDMLLGDESFVTLRNKRARHRTLETVEKQTSQFVQERMEEEKAAEGKASQALSDAQLRLNERVAEVRNRTDLDEQTKQIMVQNLQEVENKRFESAKAGIEASKNAALAASREETEERIRAIQNGIKSIAVLLPPVPAFVLGVMIFLRRQRRERDGEAAARRIRG